LKAIFDTHYADKPRKFIELFIENKELPVKEMIALFEAKTANALELNALDVVKPPQSAEVAVRANMVVYASLVNMGVRKAVAPHDECLPIGGGAQTAVY
jgi:hypothetical protein